MFTEGARELLLHILNRGRPTNKEQSIIALANLVQDASVQSSWVSGSGGLTHSLVKQLLSRDTLIRMKALDAICALCVNEENVLELLRCNDALQNIVQVMEDARKLLTKGSKHTWMLTAVLCLRRIAEFEDGRTLIKNWNVMQRIEPLMQMVCMYVCVCMYACVYVYGRTLIKNWNVMQRIEPLIQMVCMCLCMYACIYVYVYVYTHL